MSLTIGEVKRVLRQRAPGWRMAVVAVAAGASVLVFYKLTWSSTKGVSVGELFRWRANGQSRELSAPKDDQGVVLAALVSEEALEKLLRALGLVAATHTRHRNMDGKKRFKKFFNRVRIRFLFWGNRDEVELLD